MIREDDSQQHLIPEKAGSEKGSKHSVQINDAPLDDNLSHDIARHQEEAKREEEEKDGFPLEETKQRLTEAQAKAEQTLDQIQTKFGFLGDPVQIAQQNSLAALATQITISTFLALLISQIDPLQWLWELIPLLDYVSVTLFLVCLVLVQFFRTVLVKVSLKNITFIQPWNFLFFLVHTISKVFLLTYFSVWFEDFRMEVFFVDVIFIIGYMFFNIYSASQAGQPADVTVRGNLWRLILYSVLVSLFLVFIIKIIFFQVLFTRSSIWVWLMLNVFSLIYAFFLLLSMQRFPEHTYLLTRPNDFYLGAAQLDADLFLPCSFIRYIFKGLRHEDGVDIQ